MERGGDFLRRPSSFICLRMENMNSSKASRDFFVLRGWFAGGKPSRFATAPTLFGAPWSWSEA
jgi:hypothetical protein